MPAVSSLLYLASAVVFCSHSIPVVQGFSPSSTDQSQLRNLRQPSDLFYRSHPDSISSVRQIQHRHATAKILQHQQQAKEPKHHVSNIFHTWWTASKSRRALAAATSTGTQQGKKQGDQHVVMDNYLESIDRRYKRLHSHDRKKTTKDPDTVSNVASNLAWNFLTQTDSSSAVDEQRKQADAIYVLGLAELASRQLLQKHHLPIPESKWKNHDNSIVIEAQSSAIEQSKVDAPSNGVVSVVSPKTSILASAVFCIQVVKNVQNAIMVPVTRVSNKAKAAVIDSVKVGGKALRTIAMNGGGASKYAVHFLSIFAMTLVAAAISALGPLLTKA